MYNLSKLIFNINHKKFYIRRLKLKDINNDYLSWFSETNSNYIESRATMKNKDNLIKYFKKQNLNTNVVFLGVFSKFEHEHIGNIKFEFTKNQKISTFGIFIGNKKFTGKGYGKIIINICCSYIKKKIGVVNFCLGVHKENTYALRLYRKIGFKIISKNFSAKTYLMKKVYN